MPEKTLLQKEQFLKNSSGELAVNKNYLVKMQDNKRSNLRGENNPVFRFFRYFSVLFLLINVLPILILILWNEHYFQQMREQHEQHFLNFALNNVQSLPADYLDKETQYYKQIIDNIPLLSLERYQALFKTAQVGWIDQKQQEVSLSGNSSHLAPHQITAIIKYPLQEMKGDYIILRDPRHNQTTLATAFTIPLKQEGIHQGILVVKPVPLKAWQPQGPFTVEVYAGDRIAPSYLIETLNNPILRQLKGLKMKQSLFKQSQKAFKHSKLYRTIFIKNGEDQTVATMAVYQMRPPNNLMQAQDYWLGGIIFLATGAIFSVVAGHYLQKNFMEPLFRLSETAQVVHQGNWNARLDISGIKHADVLATASHFNYMIEQLAEKEQLRKNFITNLTHDLRTPLIAQERTLVLLAEEFEKLNLAKQTKLAQSLVDNNQRLLGMVNQLLEAYKFEEGQIKLFFRSVNIPALVEQCLERLAPLALENHIELKCSFPDDFSDILADADCLKRVFLNLLANAIENIPRESTVVISGKSFPEYVEIHIRDNGTGISAEDQKHLFERYFSGGDTQKIGSGLGLYICKMFVEAHKGRISVESVPDEYTDFCIELPLNPEMEESRNV